MIKKEKISAHISALIKLEERLIPLFESNLSTPLLFSGLEEGERDRLKEFFRNRVSAQKRHIDILKGIADDIRESDNDVF